VKSEKEASWRAFSGEIKSELEEAVSLLQDLSKSSSNKSIIEQLQEELSKALNPIRKDVISTVRRALWASKNENTEAKRNLISWYSIQQKVNEDRYNSYLYSQSTWKAENIEPVPAEYDGDAPMVDGREILQACFDHLLKNDPKFFAFGEDVGKIGDVNQAFAGLQAKYGELRVTDTGIRECTIIGQGIGAALRGLRPMAEIQYLDYIYYALMTLADDLACLQYRTKGGKKHR
jgi:hypothetical protein